MKNENRTSKTPIYDSILWAGQNRHLNVGILPEEHKSERVNAGSEPHWTVVCDFNTKDGRVILHTDWIDVATEQFADALVKEFQSMNDELEHDRYEVFKTYRNPNKEWI